MVIDSERYEQDIFHALAQGINYPTIIALLLIIVQFSIPVPLPIWDGVVFSTAIAVWSLIGFIIYSFYKIFTSKAID
jgi:uncharacterized membrane protein